MKVTVLALCLLAVSTCRTLGSPVIEKQIDPLEQPEALLLPEGMTEEEYTRFKRSGSFDLFGFIKNGFISKIARASAGASASSSSGKSYGGGGYEHYGPPPTSIHDSKAFDLWGLKKSILNTLFQAVKAITGGVTVVGGKLIKGGGYLISGKGKVIAAKGELISNLGKHIASSAVLSPPYSKHSAPSGPAIHTSTYVSAPEVIPSHATYYGPPSGHSGHSASSGEHSSSHSSSSHGGGYSSSAHAGYSSGGSAPPSGNYGPPSGPGSSYDVHSSSGISGSYGGPIGPDSLQLPQKYALPIEGLHHAKHAHSDGLQAGILILKPIDSSLLNLGSSGSSGPDHGHHGDAGGLAAHIAESTKEKLSGAVDTLKGILGSLSTQHGSVNEVHTEEHKLAIASHQNDDSHHHQYDISADNIPIPEFKPLADNHQSIVESLPVQNHHNIHLPSAQEHVNGPSLHNFPLQHDTSSSLIGSSIDLKHVHPSLQYPGPLSSLEKNKLYPGVYTTAPKYYGSIPQASPFHNHHVYHQGSSHQLPDSGSVLDSYGKPVFHKKRNSNTWDIQKSIEYDLTVPSYRKRIHFKRHSRH